MTRQYIYVEYPDGKGCFYGTLEAWQEHDLHEAVMEWLGQQPLDPEPEPYDWYSYQELQESRRGRWALGRR